MVQPKARTGRKQPKSVVTVDPPMVADGVATFFGCHLRDKHKALVWLAAYSELLPEPC